jgi:hypothetical protein
MFNSSTHHPKNKLKVNKDTVENGLNLKYKDFDFEDYTYFEGKFRKFYIAFSYEIDNQDINVIERMRNNQLVENFPVEQCKALMHPIDSSLVKSSNKRLGVLQ